MVRSQDMFMLFFSILYGIMLDSLIGRGAFPITSALAHRDLEKMVRGKPKWTKGNKSIKRFTLSIVSLNVIPLIYFAIIFQSLGGIVGEIINNIAQILSIGLLSLGVFAFYYFFLGFGMSRHKRNYLFYTSYEHKELLEKRRTIYTQSPWTHILAGILYLMVPWLVVLIFRIVDFL